MSMGRKAEFIVVFLNLGCVFKYVMVFNKRVNIVRFW